MFIPHNTKTVNLACKSKCNRKRENQVVLLMIKNGKKSGEVDKWHYTTLKIICTDDRFNRPIRSLSRLFSGIISNHVEDFYYLGFLYSFRTDKALKKHERLCDNNDYCHVEMPTVDNNKLKYNDGEKSLKASFTIYADLECLLIKQQSCQNNTNESYTEIGAMHVPSCYALRLISSFNSKENKHNFYRGRDCIDKFCSDLKVFEAKIINYKEKEMIPLTDNENNVRKSFAMIKMKKINLNYTKKLEIIVIIQEDLEG